MTTLLTARDVRVLADALDLRPTKQRGQNFVIDPNTVRMIVDAAHLPPASTVVEIGPGLGSLTLGLLDAGHRVVAVEIDGLLASRLPATVEQFAADRFAAAAEAGAPVPFALVHEDALRVGELPQELGVPTALVANLPYNVAVPVLLHFLATFPQITQVLVMVQAEVADRLAAGPGSRTYGVPSVKAQWYGTVERAGDIGKNVFWPAPNIDSGLVRITRRETPREGDRAAVFAVVDAAFAQRRKTLRAALTGWAGSGAAAEAVLSRAGIDPRARGEVLGVEEFARIAEARAELDAEGEAEGGAAGRRRSGENSPGAVANTTEADSQ
ncbi:16S rRNA (adenine(1518)-N(6)/adenine(1519)-N(6))-dimethyltransferase RsmA [Brevibacterium album]|uniref:16S rRNA (adenine(1518)-N(6)/adenine(1519)-N(6))- dimethyltransferase RsmA n=1 Tax=Brevibacterium album TaxID=417948 RepID=UPI0003F4FC8B|nr:16S rRNA (adenine(1518)-N(6)/adenine(1519)-N(6))-dimethyltransferase RsmA [Brevibacterium album]